MYPFNTFSNMIVLINRTVPTNVYLNDILAGMSVHDLNKEHSSDPTDLRAVISCSSLTDDKVFDPVSLGLNNVTLDDEYAKIFDNITNLTNEVMDKLDNNTKDVFIYLLKDSTVDYLELEVQIYNGLVFDLELKEVNSFNLSNSNKNENIYYLPKDVLNTRIVELRKTNYDGDTLSEFYFVDSNDSSQLMIILDNLLNNIQVPKTFTTVIGTPITDDQPLAYRVIRDTIKCNNDYSTLFNK